MDYSQTTKNLLDRMCRNVEREDFVLDKEKGMECLMQTYDLFGLVRPKKVCWHNDIFDDEWNNTAWSAGSARSAGSVGSARSAGSALDYDFDWFVIEYEYCKNRKDNPGYEPNENDEKYLQYSELLMQAKEHGIGYRIEVEDTLHIAPTPIVKINALNQFHSDTDSAIRWKESKEFFYLNGVNFPKELWEKVVSGKMPFRDILAIEDIDQRTQSMRYSDVREFLRHTKAEKLNHSTRGNELWEIPQNAGIFSINAYYLIYTDPSTGKEYMSGVAPEVGEKGNADEAMGWKFNVTLVEYNSLKVEG